MPDAPSPKHCGWNRLRASLDGARDRFGDSLRRCAAVQQDQLRAILAAACDTAFGRRHSFAAIGGARDFREAVPVQNYEALPPWNEICGEPVVACERTGGTTRGSKLIPYTAAGLDAFRRALFPWLDDLLRSRPR
ncbi:MAG: GH3 family domain-containing protein, partial [Bryobacteraceae bacterium]